MNVTKYFSFILHSPSPSSLSCLHCIAREMMLVHWILPFVSIVAPAIASINDYQPQQVHIAFGGIIGICDSILPLFHIFGKFFRKCQRNSRDMVHDGQDRRIYREVWNQRIKFHGLRFIRIIHRRWQKEANTTHSSSTSLEFRIAASKILLTNLYP